MGWRFIPGKKYLRHHPLIRLYRHGLEIHPWEKNILDTILSSGCIVMGWRFIPGKKIF